MAILLKTTSIRVSSIQIMQVRLQNRGKVFGKVDTLETYQGGINKIGSESVYPHGYLLCILSSLIVYQFASFPPQVSG